MPTPNVRILRTAIALIAATVATLVLPPASAHHSYAGYDRCKSFTITGKIERISWSNPHVVFTVKIDDSRSYLVQWLDPQRLAHFGLTSNSLKLGDRVEVTGSKNRDPNVRILTLITAVQRPADGWQWTLPAPITADCRG